MVGSPALDLDALLQGTPFRAVARLGAGGMGEIYEAVGPFGGEPVVVKVLRAELVDQAELVERLRREGEMLQFLSHPNIVASYGHGTTAAGRPYVVLERLVGSTLRQELARRSAIPVGEALAYVRQLLSALARVHDAGVVHRDVKPGNVMVCLAARGARIKLIDFGVAKVEREARRLVGPIAFPTREGTCLGTPRYISPEQAIGLDVDRRTDIYAAGMLLYTLVAGRGPFDDIVGVKRVLEAHIAQEPPPPSRFMALPLAPPIEAVILRAIAKNPAERFADVGTFRRELAQAWAKVRGAGRRVPASGRRGKPDALRPAFERGAPSYAHRPAFDAVPHPLSRGFVTARRLRSRPGSGAGRAFARCFGRADPPLGRRQTDRGGESHPQRRFGRRKMAGESGPGSSGGKARVFPGPISRRGVVFSAAAFFAVAAGLAMWFVR